MKAIGLIELPNFVDAVEAVDIMLKTAEVKFLTWEKKLGGRLVTIIIQGEVSAVTAVSYTHLISPKKHTFTSILYSAEEDKFYEEAPYEDIEVVDRIGSGDAYVAGMLFGLLKYRDYKKALEFGNAMSAVKNTIPGDLPASDFREIQNMIYSHQSTGTQSEMNR